jgi:hypothetical protein
LRYAPAFFTCLSLLIPVPSSATPITYSYQSSAFDYVPSNPGFPAGITAISAMFSVDDLPANVTNYLAPITLLSMSDGLTTITGATTDYALSSSFTTNAFAQITSISIDARRLLIPSQLPVGTNTNMRFRQDLLVNWIAMAEVDYCWSYDGSSLCNTGYYLGAYDPGTVSIVPTVPEPGSVALFGAGLAALGFLRWRAARLRWA